MPILDNYSHFQGRHWETGSVHNFMSYCGYTLPHNGEPPSEALLMGVSGGAVMGYFSFAYKGYDPQCNILTRNTFDPLDTLLARLGVEQNVRHSTSEDKGRRNLINTLEDGSPAIVWADPFALPYNNMPGDEGLWGMMPVLVFGYDGDENIAYIADRASVPLTASTAELDTARGRVKKIRQRLLTLGPANADKVATAVTDGIQDAINLYTKKPPKGAAHNFGFAAYRHWADLLTKPKMRASWEKEFPAGPRMYAGLTSAYGFINHFGKGQDDPAERQLYARFLDEAAIILQKPALRKAADHFRRAGHAWEVLSQALLSGDMPLLDETRQLMQRRHQAFVERGNEALTEIKEIDNRLGELREEAEHNFPLSEDEAVAYRQQIANRVMDVHDREQEAVQTMASAFG
jgi:hypothetical protein